MATDSSSRSLQLDPGRATRDPLDQPPKPGPVKDSAPVQVIEISLFEAALNRVLRVFLPTITSGTAQAEFWAVYQREAETYDREFAKKYDEDLNTTLIFAGLFSAVTSTFIIDIQAELKPDYAEATTTLLLVLIQEVKNLSSQGLGASIQAPSLPEWKPHPPVVIVQAMFYASLASSLLAAFLAVLGKQWLNRYVRGRDSGPERGFHRQVKLDGMKQWCFSIVMEALPLMLQIALLLFGCALSRYLWTINRAVAMVVLVFTTFGILAYALLVIVATASYACPYQTPLSVILRFILDFDAKHSRYLPRCMSSASLAFVSLVAGVNKLRLRLPYVWARIHPEEMLPMNCQDVNLFTPSENVLPLTDVIIPLFPITDRIAELRRHTLNAACTSWIMAHSTENDVIHATLRCIPDIEWYHHVPNVPPPTEHTFQSTLACFDRTGNLIPGSRDRAYTSLKAFIHCVVQENTRDTVAAKANLPRHLDNLSYDGLDDDLKSTLNIYHHITGCWAQNYRMFDAETTTVSDSHLAWSTHILVSYMWWRCRQSPPGTLVEIPYDLFAFIRHCFSERGALPHSVNADLIATAALTLGTPFHVDDLAVADKSEKMDILIGRACAHLALMARQGFSPSRTRRWLDVLRILTLNPTHPMDSSSHWAAATQSLRDFLSAVLDSDIDEDKKLETAHLVLKLEFMMNYGPSGLVITNHRLQSVFWFLRRLVHLPLTERPEWCDESLIHTIRALRNSLQGNESVFWDKGVIGYLRLALLDADHSRDVRLTVLGLVGDVASSAPTPDCHGLVTLVAEFSAILRDFWDGLTRETRRGYAKEYLFALRGVFRAPGSYQIIFRDQWRALDEISEGGESDDLVMRRQAMRLVSRVYIALPGFVKEESSDAGRAWAEMVGRRWRETVGEDTGLEIVV